MLNRRCGADGPIGREAGERAAICAPLAHLALALIGEGECFDEKGARRRQRRSVEARAN